MNDWIPGLPPGHSVGDAVLDATWRAFARPDQLPPSHDWRIWLLLGGRGAGKTRAGAEWVRAQVNGGARRIALVAPTYADGRDVMVEGESGLLSIGLPSERPLWQPSLRRLTWPGGAVATLYSGQDPDGLRGPQFDAAWADEFCAWEYPTDTLSNLRFALRLGTDPRLVMTTTPRTIPALKTLMATPGLVTTRAGTADNAHNLAAPFLDAVEATYGGTRLGRQELMGEIIEDAPGALWQRETLDAARLDAAPALDKVVVAIDPPVSSGERSDACGLVVAGRAGEGRESRIYVLHDGTVRGLSPKAWAEAAIRLWEVWDADYLLAEVNQGGEMVSETLESVEADIPLRTVYASKGKTARAEPVAALYEQGRVFHVGRFDALEDELCLMGAPRERGQGRSRSPDRADALVWAVSELALKSRSRPRIRTV